MTDEELIQHVEDTVAETLAYFDGPEQTTGARVGDWAAWDVLAHFLYWHQATAWGIACASGGGPPWKLPAGADDLNRVTSCRTRVRTSPTCSRNCAPSRSGSCARPGAAGPRHAHDGASRRRAGNG